MRASHHVPANSEATESDHGAEHDKVGSGAGAVEVRSVSSSKALLLPSRESTHAMPKTAPRMRVAFHAGRLPIKSAETPQKVEPTIRPQ